MTRVQVALTDRVKKTSRSAVKSPPKFRIDSNTAQCVAYQLDWIMCYVSNLLQLQNEDLEKAVQTHPLIVSFT